jgi:hypothetical protein
MGASRRSSSSRTVRTLFAQFCHIAAVQPHAPKTYYPPDVFTLNEVSTVFLRFFAFIGVSDPSGRGCLSLAGGHERREERSTPDPGLLPSDLMK